MSKSPSSLNPPAAPMLQWTLAGRAIVFVLASASILCLLADFYRLCSMRTFTLGIFLPACAVLIVLAGLDKSRGDGRLAYGIVAGALAGLIAAGAYDLFRIPFVYAAALGIQRIVPQLPLFKVFPRFGAMILGQPVEQPAYALPAHVVGWAYHFGNGMTFGIMYLALVGSAARRSWAWAILFATALEAFMLLSPYTNVLAIKITPTFVAVTMAAHAIFGVTLGLWLRWRATAMNPSRVVDGAAARR